MDKPDKRLKVALLFSGQPRYLDNPYPRSSHKKHIIDRYDTDVFCHTWWDKENECYPVGSWSTISKCDSSGKELEIIKKAYNPKILVDETPCFFEFEKESRDLIDSKFEGQEGWNEQNYSNILSSLCGIESVIDLVKDYSILEGVEYDFVILSRYDNIIYKFPDLYKLEKDKFYLSDHHPKFPDLIFFFGSKFLDAFKIYSNVDELVKENIGEMWGPSMNEPLKFFSYRKHFDISDIRPVPLPVRVVRDDRGLGDTNNLQRYGVSKDDLISGEEQLKEACAPWNRQSVQSFPQKGKSAKDIKVAAFVFGQPRFLDNPHTFTSQKEAIFDRYQVDTFCHLWWEKNGEDYDYSKWAAKEGGGFHHPFLSDVKSDNESINKIIDRYKPKVLKFEKPSTFKNDSLMSEIRKRFLDCSYNEHNLSNFLSQAYSIEQTAKLFKDFVERTSGEYDFIFMCRPDLVINSFPLLKDLDQNKFYLSDQHNGFPDLSFLFGTKFIDSCKIYSHMMEEGNPCIENIRNSNGEQFKFSTFKKFYDLQDLTPIKMDLKVVRNNEHKG